MVADFTGDRMLDVANPNVVHEAAFARINKKIYRFAGARPQMFAVDWRTRPAIIYHRRNPGLSI